MPSHGKTCAVLRRSLGIPYFFTPLFQFRSRKLSAHLTQKIAEQPFHKSRTDRCAPEFCIRGTVDDVVERATPVAVYVVPGAVALELDDALAECGGCLPAALLEV